MDSYQSIQDMRAKGHLDGLQILDVVYRNGWASVDRRSYLTGESFTVADAYLSVILGWTKWVGIELERWPALGRYVARIAERPAVQAALEAEGLK